MALMKATPEGNIPMTQEEEAEIRAYWAMREAENSVPPEPNDGDKLRWLLDGGHELVQYKMNEWLQMKDKMQPLIEEKRALYQAANKTLVEAKEREHAAQEK